MVFYASWTDSGNTGSGPAEKPRFFTGPLAVAARLRAPLEPVRKLGDVVHLLGDDALDIAFTDHFSADDRVAFVGKTAELPARFADAASIEAVWTSGIRRWPRIGVPMGMAALGVAIIAAVDLFPLVPAM